MSIGETSYTTGSYSISLGSTSASSQAYGIAIGYSASASAGTYGTSIGYSTSSGAKGIALGYTSTATNGGLSLGGNITNSLANTLVLNTISPASPYNVATSYFTGEQINQVSGAFATYTGSYGNPTMIAWTQWYTTTTATQVELGTGANSDTPSTYPALLPNSIYNIRVLVSAIRTDVTGEYASWGISFTTYKAATNGTLVVSTPTVTQIGANAGNSWAVAVTADTTNGRPAIKVTGEAAKTIKWAAYVDGLRIII